MSSSLADWLSGNFEEIAAAVIPESAKGHTSCLMISPPQRNRITLALWVPIPGTDELVEMEVAGREICVAYRYGRLVG